MGALYSVGFIFGEKIVFVSMGAYIWGGVIQDFTVKVYYKFGTFNINERYQRI